MRSEKPVRVRGAAWPILPPVLPSVLLFVLLTAGLSAACGGSRSSRAGTVVDLVQPGLAASEAGLRPGDVVLSFARAAALPASPQPAAGALSSCFAVVAAEIEQAPRGRVTLTVLREGKTFDLPLPPGGWWILGHPRDPASPARAACEAAVRGRRAFAANDFPVAVRELRQALAAARPLGDPLASAWLVTQLGLASENVGDVEGARRFLDEALALRRRAAPGSLAEAASWHSLGYFELRRDPERARAALVRAVELRTRHAPQSLVRSASVNALGIHYFFRGDFVRAQKLYEQALALTLALRPGTEDEADARNNLALVARESGDPALAERYFEQAAAIFSRVAPDSRSYANLLYNLGTLAGDHGDYARAEPLLRAALERHRKIAPEGVEVTTILVNLGLNALDMRNPAEARQWIERALALERRTAPGSLNEALALNSLARIASGEGRLEEAERLARQALAIRRKEAPESRDLAASYARLAEIDRRRGNLRGARDWLDLGLACRNLLPGSSYQGSLLFERADIAFRLRDFARAQRLLGEALAIYRRLSPQSYPEALALWKLAEVYRDTGRPALAEETLEAAAATLEAQTGRLPEADEVRATAGKDFADLYRDLAALQVRRGRPEAALSTLERSRGQSLLAAIARRDLAPAADLDPALLERRRQIDRRYEGIQDRLAARDPASGEIGELTTRLAQLRRERNALAAEIRRRSPRYASLRYPQPLTAAGIAASLEPGTTLLAYSTGDEGTLLFVVSAPPAAGAKPGLRVFPLSVGRRDLAEEVDMFRSLLLRGPDAAGEGDWARMGQRLYGRLISPAAEEIARADRLLISADGPLFQLPFAALVRPGQRVSFLIEEKPLHSVLSATLYADLRRARPARPDPRSKIVVFADPFFGAGPPRRFLAGLPPLPGARDEGRALAALFGSDTVVWSGREATEARAKHLPRRLRYLHFATHALLDSRFPLDSALALAAPTGRAGEDNGLLQAWEIFGLRLDADLVTLSACDTGRGQDVGSEGLLGLTRAFQYAGARSIVASLWQVDDRASARLMERFYTELRAGTPKDLALQRAQLSLVRQPGGTFAHPYHWGAFGLIGDWR